MATAFIAAVIKAEQLIKVVVIGSGGRVGSRIATELLARGHGVTGVERSPGKGPARPGVIVKQGDATHPASLAPLLMGHDAVISATRFQTSDANALVAAVKTSGVKRLLVVGGAATLEVAPGKALIDAAGFPEGYRAEATAGARFLAVLRREQSLEWTFLSPSAEFGPGARTGKFRVGHDALLSDSNRKSWISMEDFAIAMVDELENAAHVRQRFTVGY